MNTLPYQVIDCSSNNNTVYNDRIGFDTAALLRPGTILSIPPGRFIIDRTEINLIDKEAHMTIYAHINKFELINPAKNQCSNYYRLD